MKTIREILLKAKLNQKITDGKRVWQVISLDFDGVIVAKPLKFPKKESSFELWSQGVESLACIPNLKLVKE